MTTPPEPAAAAREMLADLHRLVEAIDRRVPQLKRLSEARIAREAAELRARASALIRDLESAELSD